MKKAANLVILPALTIIKTREISAGGQRRNLKIWVWKCPVKFRRKFKLLEKVNYRSRRRTCKVPPQILRIIDANCNRIGEGLRFLEDIARFILNDSALSRQLKSMRHDLVTSLSCFGPALLSERRVETDVGIAKRISHWQDLLSLVTANARRVEEALRVVEELSKLPELSPQINQKNFEAARFNLYKLQRELISRLARRQKIAQLAGLYVIIDTQTIGSNDVVDTARKIIKGGAKIIQLRDKHHNRGELLVIAKTLSDLCHKNSVLFIVNDYLDIVLASVADGIHIGQEDLPLSVIRRELPVDSIIGLSVSTPAQARKAEKAGADYIAVSAIYPSSTKPEVKAVGLAKLSTIEKAVSIPVVAIGGINGHNIGDIMASGADAAAVISAVLSQTDIESATRQLVKEIEKQAKSRKKS
jgi:thiamine-phosphate pyrophosphorylase